MCIAKDAGSHWITGKRRRTRLLDAMAKMPDGMSVFAPAYTPVVSPSQLLQRAQRRQRPAASAVSRGLGGVRVVDLSVCARVLYTPLLSISMAPSHLLFQHILII